MAKEFEREGLPTALVSALPLIPLSIGANRIVRGRAIVHPLGNPALSREMEREVRRGIVLTALRALETPVRGPTVFE